MLGHRTYGLFTEFVNFAIRVLKDNPKFTTYLFMYLKYVSVDCLSKLDFNLLNCEINRIVFYQIHYEIFYNKGNYLDYKIDNLDVLILLSNQDNFNDFVKLNKSFLLEYSNKECHNYLSTFL